MSLRTILAEDKTLITFRPSLRRVLGSVKSVILFQQILYWYTHTGGKFYKFTSPCTHKLYKEGDSFSEETSLSAKEIRGALESFAFKCGKKNKDLYGDSYEETRDAAMVLYYTDSNRVTWYKLNEEVVEAMLNDLYNRPESTYLIKSQRALTKVKSLKEVTKVKSPRAVTSSTETTTETTRENISTTPKDFDRFWDAYGKKVSKGQALRAFHKAIKAVSLKTMCSAIEKQKKTDKWRNGFQPNASTWLNGMCWEDDINAMMDRKREEQKQKERLTLT